MTESCKKQGFILLLLYLPMSPQNKLKGSVYKDSFLTEILQSNLSSHKFFMCEKFKPLGHLKMEVLIFFFFGRTGD